MKKSRKFKRLLASFLSVILVFSVLYFNSNSVGNDIVMLDSIYVTD